MQRGDIGGDHQPYAPRVLVQFERIVSRPPDRPSASYKLALSLGRWGRVLEDWQPDRHVSGQLWDWVWRRDLRADLFTFELPSSAVPHLERWVDKHNLPLAHVLRFATPEALEYDYLHGSPDVIHVVHGDTRRPFFCGRRGMLVTDTGRMDL